MQEAAITFAGPVPCMQHRSKVHSAAFQESAADHRSATCDQRLPAEGAGIRQQASMGLGDLKRL
eukprot:1159066-Pelagomonas_calceolata.AAC.3